MLKVEAACGSEEAIRILAQRIVDEQNQVLRQGEAPDAGSHATSTGFSRQECYDRVRKRILRTIERGRDRRRVIPPGINDAAVWTALMENGLNDWYVLYLLAAIIEPQDQDRERVREIWDKKDRAKRLVAVDVLWLWGDLKALRQLREQRLDKVVGFEMLRALNALELAQTAVPDPQE